MRLFRSGSKMLRKKLKLTISETEKNITSNSNCNAKSSVADEILRIELELNDSLKVLKFTKPVSYVYSPLDYAIKPHETFTRKYCNNVKKVLFVGMNPGPWGMCQTGVPFGEISIVKNWFGIEEEVSKPEKECPERRIQGFACSRSEVSGKRLWGLLKDICETPENFFANAFMYNYCPIAMMKDNGGNVTPDEIKGTVQDQLQSECDLALKKIIELLQIEILVAVGKFVEKRATIVLKDANTFNTQVLYLVHPSPRVKGNQNWPAVAQKKFEEFDLVRYFKSS